MRAETFARLAVVLGGLTMSASAQYGGGFAPPKQAPPQAEPPAAPAAPPPKPSEDPEDAPAPDADDSETPPATAPAPTPDQDSKPSPSAPPPSRIECTPPDKGWVARLDAADRSAIDATLGYAMPAPGGKVKWLGAATSAPDMKGKVVVIQTIDASTSTSPLDHVMNALGESASDAGLVVIGLQVPNKLEAANKRLAKSRSTASLCVDEGGEWCDALGAYRKPVNFVVDRNGAVRYAGLSPKGIAAASNLLLKEPKQEVTPMARPTEESASTSTPVDFPKFTESVGGCNDLRGKASPELSVDQWITKQPSTSGKVIIVDFFFTGCPPCRAAIPHMNEIVAQYGDKIAVVGVSFENKSTFDSGMNRYKLKTSDFHYALGLDTSRRTIGAFGVQAYPNIAIISADGIVRWQGHPGSLNSSVLDPIVAANEALGKSASKSGNSSRGWAKAG